MRTNEIIKKIMEFHTNLEVSEKTGYHINTISAWRNGKNEPPFYGVMCIAEACGYEIKFKKKDCESN